LLNDPVGQVTVQSNIINLDDLGVGSWHKPHVCIHVTENLGYPSGYERIAYNDLIVTDGEFGIYCASTSGTNVFDNSIQLNNPSSNLYGILIESCSSNTINSNIVTGTSAQQGNSSTLVPRGICGVSSTNCYYLCNSMLDLMVGMGFEDNCYPSSIIQNAFQNHTVGLYYNPYAITGLQDHTCNTWFGTNYYQWGALHSGGGSYAALSRYRVTTGPYTEPPSFSPGPPDPYQDWFFWPDNYTVVCNYCGSPAPQSMMDSTLTEIDYSTASNNLSYPNYQSELSFQSSRGLYLKLSNDTNLYVGNSIMTIFYDSIQNVSPGQYQNLQNLRKAALALNPVTAEYINTLSSQVKIASDSIHRLDSIIKVSLNSGDSIMFATIISSLYLNIFSLNDQINVARQGFMSLRDGNVDYVSTQNGLLPNDSLYELNEKLVNHIYLNSIAKQRYHFTIEEAFTLLEIASQCSLAGGKAVYLARSLYSAIKDTLFDDRNICLSVGIIKSMRDENKLSDNYTPKFKFNPNPANSLIYLNWDIELKQITNVYISNLLGQIVKSVSLPESGLSAEIPIMDIPSGTYQLVIKSGDRSIARLPKLIIIR
jgi:hypothetical protein